jgi:hypothetical protein
VALWGLQELLAGIASKFLAASVAVPMKLVLMLGLKVVVFQVDPGQVLQELLQVHFLQAFPP